MLTTVVSAVIAICGLAGLLLRYLMQRNSAAQEKAKDAEKTIEDIARGGIAARDNAYDKQLHDRYKNHK